MVEEFQVVFTGSFFVGIPILNSELLIHVVEAFHFYRNYALKSIYCYRIDHFMFVKETENSYFLNINHSLYFTDIMLII